MENQINLVKVFSVTKARDREELGQRVMAWIEANPKVEIVKTVVAQTSDDRFHCLSMILLCASA
jgi:trehalose/maltose hydrolase-like predicted phosphorylase